jgi:agmatine deiminase
MTRLFIIILLFLPSMLFAQGTNLYRMPGEWEEHEAVWVGLFRQPGRDSVTAQIVQAIHKNVRVRLNFDHDSVRQKFTSLFRSFAIDTTELEWIRDSVSFSWMRDPGPLFLTNRKGQRKVIDFKWMNYGNPYVFPDLMYMDRRDTLYGEIDLRMAKHMKLPVVSSRFVAEGGGIESNGEGVLMTIEETALQRNPGKTLAEIEANYKQTTGARKVIWLKKMTLHDKTANGLIAGKWFGGGANGHIDEVARYIDPHTIVIASIDKEEADENPISALDRIILEESYQQLLREKDAKGKSFRVIKFPYPNLNVYARPQIIDSSLRQEMGFNIPLKDGDTAYWAPAVGYMNFMVTNGVVLVAQYWKPGLPLREKEKDEQVMQMMQSFYPDRKIIGINPYEINRGGGGLHCATQQVPRR